MPSLERRPAWPQAPADPAQANKQFKANRAYAEELEAAVKARTGTGLPSLKSSPGVRAPAPLCALLPGVRAPTCAAPAVRPACCGSPQPPHL